MVSHMICWDLFIATVATVKSNPLLQIDAPLYFEYSPHFLRDMIDHCQGATLFGSSGAADALLDMTYVCNEAFEKYGSQFPTEVWSCCQRRCFAALAMGENPRFFGLVRSYHKEISLARRAIEQVENFLPASNSNSSQSLSISVPHTRSAAKENFFALIEKVLPVLLGQKSMDGIFGKLCVSATKKILGVSLTFIYKKRRDENDRTFSLLDASGSRQRALRRLKKREGLTQFIDLHKFKCTCHYPCLTDSNENSLRALYDKFAALSEYPNPYERENEFLIDVLYCPFTNTDTHFCDRAIAEILGVSERRVARARRVVSLLMRNPSNFVQQQIAPPHGMHQYASESHPMNRTSIQLRRAIAQGLDVAMRADPAAADGSVTYRFYDPSINTYEKIKELVHKSMSESLGQTIGELSSSTFRRLFAEYLDERDGRLSFSRADHNCCPHCQDLELRLFASEMEVKLVQGLRDGEQQQQQLALKKSEMNEAKEALDEHIGLDRMVRKHLKKLVNALREAENEGLNVALETVPLVSGNAPICPLSVTGPAWCSKPGMGLLTHQDDMTKPNIPSFFQDSLSELARYRPDVTAHVSAITGSATVISRGLGAGPKTSATLFESILIDHMLTCEGENLKIIWSDCASVGRSFFLCVPAMQFLVDSGFCDLALAGYMANCHGKYLADGLFGQWSRRARNENITSIDGLLGVFEQIKRSRGNAVQGIILNPIAAIQWQENLASLGYATTPPPDFGWENKNPHYACACKPNVKDTLPESVREILEPLMPKYENCVRVTSWPRFEEHGSTIPFQQRPIDVPAARVRQRTANGKPKGSGNGFDGLLVVPKSQPFAEGGSGVWPKSTAEIVGHNASGLVAKVPLLRQRGILVQRSWPEGFSGPPHCQSAEVKVAPENWVARRTVQACTEQPLARYPPLNYYNALEGRPPREIRERRHQFVATYVDPPFPIMEGTCSYDAAIKLEAQFSGLLDKSVSVLDLYKAVRLEMDLTGEKDLDEYLQPRAKPPCEEARKAYLEFLKENRIRNKRKPATKRTAYQIFRADDDEREKLRLILREKKQNGDTGATLPSVAATFWARASDAYKKKFKDLVLLEDDRIEQETVI